MFERALVEDEHLVGVRARVRVRVGVRVRVRVEEEDEHLGVAVLDERGDLCCKQGKDIGGGDLHLLP